MECIPLRTEGAHTDAGRSIHRKNQVVKTYTTGRSTGIERICGPKEREDRHQARSSTEFGFVGMGFDHRTCRHRMRAGGSAPIQHI